MFGKLQTNLSPPINLTDIIYAYLFIGVTGTKTPKIENVDNHHVVEFQAL